jgi:hypothetical protein
MLKNKRVPTVMPDQARHDKTAECIVLLVRQRAGISSIN